MAKFIKNSGLQCREEIEVHKIGNDFKVWSRGKEITDRLEKGKYLSTFIAHCLNITDNWDGNQYYYKCSEEIQKEMLKSLENQIKKIQCDMEITMLCKDLILSSIEINPYRVYDDKIKLVTFSYANNGSYNPERDTALAVLYENSDLEFTVSRKWLEKYLDFEVTYSWLNEYTHEDGFNIYKAAKKDSAVLEENIKIYNTYIESLQNN